MTPERKIADHGDAGIVGGEGALEQDGVASEIDGVLPHGFAQGEGGRGKEPRN